MTTKSHILARLFILRKVQYLCSSCLVCVFLYFHPVLPPFSICYSALNQLSACLSHQHWLWNFSTKKLDSLFWSIKPILSSFVTTTKDKHLEQANTVFFPPYFKYNISSIFSIESIHPSIHVLTHFIPFRVMGLPAGQSVVHPIQVARRAIHTLTHLGSRLHVFQHPMLWLVLIGWTHLSQVSVMSGLERPSRPEVEHHWLLQTTEWIPFGICRGHFELSSENKCDGVLGNVVVAGQHFLSLVVKRIHKSAPKGHYFSRVWPLWFCEDKMVVT